MRKWQIKLKSGAKLRSLIKQSTTCENCIATISQLKDCYKEMLNSDRLDSYGRDEAEEALLFLDGDDEIITKYYLKTETVFLIMHIRLLKS